MQYSVLFRVIVERHGLQSRFQGEKGMKRKCNVLAKNVWTKALRMRIKTLMEYPEDDTPMTDIKLQVLITDEALKVNEMQLEQAEEQKKKRPANGNQGGSAQKKARNKDTKPKLAASGNSTPPGKSKTKLDAGGLSRWSDHHRRVGA